MAPKTQTETQRLRKFGLVMAVGFGLIGALLLWRGRDGAVWLEAVAGAFLVLGLAAPRALRIVEGPWMRLAHLLGLVMTTLILTLTFFLVLTPLGWFLRLTGRDLLGMKGDPAIPSYWVPVEPDGPSSRPDKPY